MKKIIIGIVIAIVLLVGYNVAYYMSAEDVIISVTKTERIVESSGESVSSKYLIFTDSETFENTDSFLFWKWNSSDYTGKFSKTGTFGVKVAGWRIPFFSMYRNIVEEIY